MTSSVPRLVELDDASLGRQRTRVGPWLTTVAGLQTAFRRLLGDTVRMAGDPLASGWLSGMHERAREHEARVDDLFAAFELDRPGPSALPAPLTALAGAVLGRTREAVGQLQGLLAGSHLPGGAWRNLRELQLANLDALGGFAVVESFGLALGRPMAVEISYEVQGQKMQDQLLLRELFLEYASDAVLYRRDL